MSGELLEAAQSGDRRRMLEALRNQIAARIDAGVDARDLAPLSLRLERVTAELDVLSGPGGEESIEDALAARRRAKEAAAG